MDIQFTTVEKVWPKHLRVLVAGDPGTGRTSFAATFPNPFIANACGGLATLAGRDIPFAEIETENDLFQVTEMISNEVLSEEMLEGYKVETLVIDSIDELQRRMLLKRMADDGRTETKIEDWGWIATRLNKIFGRLVELPVHLVVTCKLNNEVDRLLIQGQFGEQIHNYVDYAFRTDVAIDQATLSENAELIDGELVLPRELDIPRRYMLNTWADSWTHSLLGDRLDMPADFEALWDAHNAAGESVSQERTEMPDPDGAKAILEEVFSEDIGVD